MNVFIDTNFRINQLSKRTLTLNALFFLVPVLMFLTLFSLASNSYMWRRWVEQVEVWVCVYFLIVLVIANSLKLYKSWVNLIFIVWMVILNGVSALVLLSTIGKYAVFILPVLFLLSGPIFNMLLARRLKQVELNTLRKIIFEQPEKADASFKVQHTERHKISLKRLSPSLEGKIIQQYNHVQFNITKVIALAESKLVCAEREGHIALIRVTDEYIQSMTVSAKNETVHLDVITAAEVLEDLIND